MSRDHAECVGEREERRGFRGWEAGGGVISEIQGCEKQLSRTDVAERLLGAKVTYDEIGKGCCRAVGGRLNKNGMGENRVKIRAAAAVVVAAK